MEEHQASFSTGSDFRAVFIAVLRAMFLVNFPQIRSEQIRLNWTVLNPSYSRNLKNWNCLAPYFAWTQRIETITSHLYWHDLVLFMSSLAWSYSSGLLPRQIVWLCNIGTTQRPINSSVEIINSLSPKILWTFYLKIIPLLFPPILD